MGSINPVRPGASKPTVSTPHARRSLSSCRWPTQPRAWQPAGGHMSTRPWMSPPASCPSSAAAPVSHGTASEGSCPSAHLRYGTSQVDRSFSPLTQGACKMWRGVGAGAAGAGRVPREPGLGLRDPQGVVECWGDCRAGRQAGRWRRERGLLPFGAPAERVGVLWLLWFLKTLKPRNGPALRHTCGGLCMAAREGSALGAWGSGRVGLWRLGLNVWAMG
jgi:hypothetical protein